ncbi:MAG: hypothetical protein KL863_15330 [Rhizobium sp.]|nr:hypothetical protein [Rhizobium sp.]
MTFAPDEILIANGSRAALDDFRAAYPDLGVIEITARPDVIAERLAQRGRESADEIALRLKRKTGEWRPNCLFRARRQQWRARRRSGTTVRSHRGIRCGLRPRTSDLLRLEAACPGHALLLDKNIHDFSDGYVDRIDQVY